MLGGPQLAPLQPGFELFGQLEGCGAEIGFQQHPLDPLQRVAMYADYVQLKRVRDGVQIIFGKTHPIIEGQIVQAAEISFPYRAFVNQLYKSVIGVFIMIVLGNALNLLNVDSYWQRVAVGAVIIAAAAAERLRSIRSQ